MSGLRKRVWTKTDLRPEGQGYAVTLDGRPVNTPGKARLILPTRALAQAVCGEWDAQREMIDPARMPMTRAANSAIDKVTPQHAQVAQMVADYGDSDLICYRADGPDGLVSQQSAAWDPWLDWARETLAAPLVPCVGVMHQPQPTASLTTLRARVRSQDAFALTGLHDLVTLSGSLILGLAVAETALSADEAWALSRIDEAWQESLWGIDAEAAEAQAARQVQFAAADRFLELLRHR